MLQPTEAVTAARSLNEDLQSYCSVPISSDLPSDSAPCLPTSFKPLTDKRFFGLGLLPLVPGVDVKTIVSIIEEIASMDKLRGVIMGTRGMGGGLDDPQMEPIWAALDRTGLATFLHPHCKFSCSRHDMLGGGPSKPSALCLLTCVFASSS